MPGGGAWERGLHGEPHSPPPPRHRSHQASVSTSLERWALAKRRVGSQGDEGPRPLAEKVVLHHQVALRRAQSREVLDKGSVATLRALAPCGHPLSERPLWRHESNLVTLQSRQESRQQREGSPGRSGAPGPQQSRVQTAPLLQHTFQKAGGREALRAEPSSGDVGMVSNLDLHRGSFLRMSHTSVFRGCPAHRPGSRHM